MAATATAVRTSVATSYSNSAGVRCACDDDYLHVLGQLLVLVRALVLVPVRLRRPPTTTTTTTTTINYSLQFGVGILLTSIA